MVTPEPVGLGSVFALDAVFLGNTVPLRYEITDFDPPHRVVLAAENASVEVDRRGHFHVGLFRRHGGAVRR